MTDFNDDPMFEDTRRKAARMAHLEASAAASTAASLEAHRATSAVLRAGQHGVFGDVTPQQLAADVAARRRVGDGTSAGRDLISAGGTIPWESYGSGPAPARVDLSRIDQQGREPGVSPTMAWKCGQR